MSLNCDLCGGQVVPNGDDGVCSNCGLTYDSQWIRQRYVNPPAAPVVYSELDELNAEINFKSAKPKTKTKNFSWTVPVFALCAVGALAAGWFADEDPALSLGLFAGSAAVTVFTIFLIKIMNRDKN